jgi:hypothetical protein
MTTSGRRGRLGQNPLDRLIWRLYRPVEGLDKYAGDTKAVLYEAVEYCIA